MEAWLATEIEVCVRVVLVSLTWLMASSCTLMFPLAGIACRAALHRCRCGFKDHARPLELCLGGEVIKITVSRPKPARNKVVLSLLLSCFYPRHLVDFVLVLFLAMSCVRARGVSFLL